MKKKKKETLVRRLDVSETNQMEEEEEDEKEKDEMNYPNKKKRCMYRWQYRIHIHTRVRKTYGTHTRRINQRKHTDTCQN